MQNVHIKNSLVSGSDPFWEWTGSRGDEAQGCVGINLKLPRN